MSRQKHLSTFLVYTAAEFGNFELRFKYRIVAGNRARSDGS
jgi:hypothetical protein